MRAHPETTPLPAQRGGRKHVDLLLRRETLVACSLQTIRAHASVNVNNSAEAAKAALLKGQEAAKAGFAQAQSALANFQMPGGLEEGGCGVGVHVHE